MNGIQRLITTVLRPWAASIEADSRAWAYRCPNCDHERSVWEMGGIRWKAAGNSKRLMRCPACGRIGWHTLDRRRAE